MREAKKIKLKDGDKELTFVITPMSAIKAEAWIYKALIAVGLPAMPSMNEISPEGIIRALMANKALDFERISPLLDDLLECCECYPSEGVAVSVTPENVSGLVDYPTTLFALRVASFIQTFGFFGDGGLKNFLGQVSGVRTAFK